MEVYNGVAMIFHYFVQCQDAPPWPYHLGCNGIIEAALSGHDRLGVSIMTINNDTLFSERCTYYRDLENRRWQYFLGFLVVDGLLLNAWTYFKSYSDPFFLWVLCIGAIFIAIAFLRLLSRVRQRINKVAIDINELAGKKLMNVGSIGPFGLGGSTMWLYFSVIILTLLWFITLWTLNPSITIVIAAIFIGSLGAVEWTLAEGNGNQKANN